VVHLLDSFILSKPSLYFSGMLLALRSMLQMELPHVNVLTKIDNLENFGPLPFNLDFYTEVQDLHYLLPYLDAERPYLAPLPSERVQEPDEEEQEAPVSKFHGLNNALIDLITDFGLVGFETLVVEDRKSMATLLRAIDRAGGYAFGGAEGVNDTVWEIAMRDNTTTMDVRDIQERWIDRREELDELEKKQWEAEGRAAAQSDGDTQTQGASDSGDNEDHQDSGFDQQHPRDMDEDPEMRALRQLPLPDSGIKIVRRNG
jgi:GPN-loop GTPase